ncbi:MAG: hypothetical protein LAP21_14385 [Acidobacteriia bacterium]|nr:hypothetical protein [Terriglobia bacterium]
MREVKQSGDWLPEALRELGAASSRHAPPQVGAALKDAFVRRHAARRRAQHLRLAAIAAMVLLAAGIVSLRSPRSGGQGSSRSDQATPPSVPASFGTALAVNAPSDASLAASRPKPQTSGIAQRSFVALPSYDPHLTHEDLRVVRLQLSGEALRRVGVPVQEESTERLLLADFVVGQDGTPYAFRLVSQ